ncbi:hypothetical protein [Spirosoma pulveris]
MIPKATREELEALIKCKESGEITEETYRRLAKKKVEDFVDSDLRHFNRDKQINYLCYAMTEVLGSLRTLIDGQAEIYSTLHRGRKSKNLDMISRHAEQSNKRSMNLMLDQATEIKVDMKRIDRLLNECEELLDFRIGRDDANPWYADKQAKEKYRDNIIDEFQEFLKAKRGTPEKGQEKEEPRAKRKPKSGNQ